MSIEQQDDVLDQARTLFRDNKYAPAEGLLNQLILRNLKSAEVFHMLGVIYYDQGKFNKAIRSFQRALEIDPAHTDSSVGLSIILNDIGRYEEGKKVFETARSILAGQPNENEASINEKLALKHDELGEMYARIKRFEEALEQYRKALALSSRKAELSMKVVQALRGMGNEISAIRELKSLVQEYADFIPARVLLGKIYYATGQLPEAQAAWESALKRDANHAEAKHLLRQVQNLDVTRHESMEL